MACSIGFPFAALDIIGSRVLQRLRKSVSLAFCLLALLLTPPSTVLLGHPLGVTDCLTTC